MIDVNLYSGEYPFRRLPQNKGEEFLRLLNAIGAEFGVVTPFYSIFYKDNLDGLRRGIEECSGCGGRLRYYLTLNPAFPGWQQDLEDSMNQLGVVAVRLWATYHHYDLLDERVLALCEQAAAWQLPVCLTRRLVDDRLHHWLLNVHPFDTVQLQGLLKQCRSTTFILSQFYATEIEALAEVIKLHGSTYVDIGNAKPRVFWFDEITQILPADRLLLGTGAPLYYHEGTLMAVREAKLTDEERQLLLHDNATRLFRI